MEEVTCTYTYIPNDFVQLLHGPYKEVCFFARVLELSLCLQRYLIQIIMF